MIYEKDKIRRLIEYKNNYTQGQLKNDLEWIIEKYNAYYVDNKEYEYKRKEFKNITIKYYNKCDEKLRIEQEFNIVRNKYNVLKEEYNRFKSWIQIKNYGEVKNIKNAR